MGEGDLEAGFALIGGKSKSLIIPFENGCFLAQADRTIVVFGEPLTCENQLNQVQVTINFMNSIM